MAIARVAWGAYLRPSAVILMRSGSGTLKAMLIKAEIKAMKGLNKITTQIVPKTLNNMLNNDVRRAALEVPIEAKKPVTVVPILAPRTMAAEVSKLMNPWCAMAMVTPSMADEDCIIAVSTVPAKTHFKRPSKVLALNLVRKTKNSGDSAKGANAAFMASKPINNSPKPNTA